MDNIEKHILVVDDDDRIRNLLKEYLNDNKFIVSTAVDSEDAIKKISYLKVSVTEIVCILITLILIFIHLQ